MTIDATDQALLDRLFAAIDRMDVAGFVDCLTEDATFRFGSAPAAAGRDAISTAVRGFFETIHGLQHALHKAVRHDDTLVCEGEVTYTRHDDSTITLPFANVFEMAGGTIARYKIYMDIGPLYAG